MTIQIIETSWQQHRNDLFSIRRQVFIEEQGVPEALEIDDQDSDALHFLVMDDQSPVGCARLLADGHFGRVAILPSHRNRQIGGQLLATIEASARQHGLSQLEASMQCNASGFYLRNGFSARPGFFMDANIPHVGMTKALQLASTSPQQENTSLYVRGRDSQLHTLNNEIDELAALQLIMAQRPTRLDLVISSPQHSLWSHPTTAEGLSLLIRSNRRIHARILLNQEHPHLLGHPLIRTARRLSSRVEIRVLTDINLDGAIASPSCYLLDRSLAALESHKRSQHYQTCFHDPGACRRLGDHFERWWQGGHIPIELRSMLL